jgi:hypothetical protein
MSQSSREQARVGGVEIVGGVGLGRSNGDQAGDNSQPRRIGVMTELGVQQKGMGNVLRYRRCCRVTPTS